MPMHTFNVGDVLAASDLQEFCVNTIISAKGSDTSRASNTTLAVDPDLAVAVGAGKSYYMKANILYTALSGADLKFTWTVPAGTVFTGTAVSVTAGSSTSSIGCYQASGSLITSTMSAPGGGALVLALVFDGILAIAGTGGTAIFSWAQNASNATPTIVKQGSSLFLRRVA